MADTSSLQTIKSLVNGFQIKHNIEGKYVVLYQLATDAIRKLNLEVLHDSERTAKLTINTNNIAYLPDDYLSFICLYVPVNGEEFRLTERKGIIKTTTEDTGAETRDSTYGEGVDVVDNTSSNYASSSINTQGYYRIEESKQRIHFANIPRSEIVLVYKSSGLSTSEQTLINVKARPAIEAFMRRELAYVRNEAYARIQVWDKRFEEERSLLIASEIPSIYVLEDMYKREMNQTLRK